MVFVRIGAPWVTERADLSSPERVLLSRGRPCCGSVSGIRGMCRSSCLRSRQPLNAPRDTREDDMLLLLQVPHIIHLYLSPTVGLLNDTATPTVRRLQVQVRPTPFCAGFSVCGRVQLCLCVCPSVGPTLSSNSWDVLTTWVNWHSPLVQFSSILAHLFFFNLIIFVVLFLYLFSLVNIIKGLVKIANYERISWSGQRQNRVKWQKCCLFPLCWGNITFILMCASSSLCMCVCVWG